MQPQLTRSRAEVIVAGVCGGLAEYFHIDPVIVRLVFVVVTLTSGLGLIVYPVLWIVMPKAPALPPGPDAAPYGALPSQEGAYAAWGEQQAVRRAEAAQHLGARPAPRAPFGDQPPPEEEYRFDPLTGEPIRRDRPATGATVDLSRHPAALQMPPPPPQPGAAPDPAQRRGRVSWAGVLLVGLGVMMLADRLGISPDIIVPVFMVTMGALLLFRRR